MPNVETLLRDHVTLQVECVDRLYLNGYVPRLQRPENLWWFFTKHRECPVLSPQLCAGATLASWPSSPACAPSSLHPRV